MAKAGKEASIPMATWMWVRDERDKEAPTLVVGLFGGSDHLSFFVRRRAKKKHQIQDRGRCKYESQTQ
jgi:hypothetical protein